MVWDFIGVYILNRTLHYRLEIRNFSSRVVKYFLTLEEKFRISERPCIYTAPVIPLYILLPSSLKHNLCFWGIKNDNNDDNGVITSTSTWWLLLSNSNQLKSNNDFWEKRQKEVSGDELRASCSPISSPESAFLLVSNKNTASGHFQGRKSANHGLAARLRTLRILKQQRLQKRTFTTTAHKLEVAKVRVLGADRNKSGLWTRDCVFTLYKEKFDTTWAQKFKAFPSPSLEERDYSVKA